jgi:type II secretory pathway component PulC
MRTKDGLSPEEKLLRLIRGNKKSSQPQQNLSGVVNKQQEQNIKISWRLLAAKLVSDFGLRKWIFIFLCLAVVYLASSLVYPFIALRNLKVSVIKKEEIELKESPDKEEIKTYEHYLNAVQGKKIFGSVESSASERGQIATAGSFDIKDISVTGIISGDNPQAVIEDKKNQKTYYLNKGQLLGDLQVEDIQDGKVILKQNNQLYELYL